MDDPKRNDEKDDAGHPERDGEGERGIEPTGAAKDYEIIDAKPIDSSVSELETPPVEESKPFTPAPPPRAGAGPLTAVIAGAVAGAALSAVVLWSFMPETGVSPDAARRLTTLEGAAASSVGLERRIGALEDGATLQADKMAGISAYGPRLSALEAAAPEARAAVEVSKSALREAQTARSDAANALVAVGKPQVEPPAPAPAVDLGPLETRLGKLEAGVAALGAAKPDLAPLNDRIAKLETALAAPKSEARVAPDPAPAGRDNAGMLAVAAQALSQRIAAGAPYPVEQGALERLGADPARLAQLKPFANDGAPTVTALSNDFAKIAPALLSAAEPKSDDGIMSRMMANMRNVVSVHPVGEQAGDDPSALVSQIGAALGRGDVAGALKTFARLPDASRDVGKDWAAKANSRVEAAAAAQALLEDALTQLGGPRN